MARKQHKTSRLRRAPAVIAAGAGAASAALGLYMSSRILHMAKKAEETVVEREKQAGRFQEEAYSRLPKQDVWVTSQDGTRIKAVFITPFPGQPYVVYCHGVTEHKINSIKYMNIFLKRGFNAVLFDHRRHGESEGTFTSYGFFEKQDMKAVIDELKKREGDDISFGIHGESMGAVTLLLYAGTVEDSAAFYVADCPFSDFRAQVKHQMKREIRIAPDWMLTVAEWAVWLRGKFKLRDLAPLDAVQHIHKPVLFIHSRGDDFILPDMTEALYEAKPGAKQLFLAENGGHAQSYNENPVEYEQAVDAFLDAFSLRPSFFEKRVTADPFDQTRKQ